MYVIKSEESGKMYNILVFLLNISASKGLEKKLILYNKPLPENW